LKWHPQRDSNPCCRLESAIRFVLQHRSMIGIITHKPSLTRCDTGLVQSIALAIVSSDLRGLSISCPLLAPWEPFSKQLASQFKWFS